MAYEGTRYVGFQIQPNGPSIQAAVERAFERMTGFAVRAAGASRTDAGVHAREQVVCLPNPSRHEPHALLRGLNALLPDDIAVLRAEWASEGFDPRRHAVGKHYRYTIHQDCAPPVFERRLRWHVTCDLELDAMNRAVECLLGEHDFSALRGSKCEAKNPVRSIDFIGWRREAEVLWLDVIGRSFLKQMVRNIVGTCVEIGRGRLLSGKMAEILEGRDRRRAGKTAPAKGLCLMRVFYDRQAYRQALGRMRG